MKYTMLLVSQSPTTSVGLRSYLNNIFAKYIDLEACLSADLNTAVMERFDLVLFASKAAAASAAPFLTPKIHYLNCIRTFNHTYLNRILSIPANSDVYLVNDSQSTALASLDMLVSFGITQYHFIPYYPGCGEIDYSIRYAVTLGETRVVPKHIPNIIDIGARIADISTISEIASFFNLPMKLADVVTKNYINQFVQLLKVSNHQLSQAANTKFLTQSIIKNIKTGVCILNSAGVISIINKPFIDAMSIDKPHLIGTPIEDVIPEVAQKLKNPLESPVLKVNTGGGGIYFNVPGNRGWKS